MFARHFARCLAFAGALLLQAVSADRVLVVHGDDAARFNVFWRSLEKRGYELDLGDVKHGADQLRQSPDSYEHVVLFAPTVKSWPQELAPQAVVRLLERGVNVLVGLSDDATEHWRDFAREFDIDFDDRGNRVIDHFAYDARLDDGSHSTVVMPVSAVPDPFVSSATRAGPPVLYRGAGHRVGRNPLLSNVLSARPTSLSFEPSATDPPTEDLYMTGTSVGLVSVFQSRNNARIGFAGSLDMFSDDLMNAAVASSDGTSFSTSGNAAFAQDLTKWIFGETGRLKATGLEHARARDGESKGTYRVNDELDLRFSLSQLRDGSWVPYTPGDVQFEMTMLDPHLRLPMVSQHAQSAASDAAVYSARFRVPDRHGVFTLKVGYRRPGWTWIEQSATVSVTPPRHDEFERFVGGASPFYFGAISVSAGTLLFLNLWLSQ